ncbi:MAG: hypothetical protein U1F43_34515 [Myxococcota bacterium]
MTLAALCLSLLVSSSPPLVAPPAGTAPTLVAPVATAAATTPLNAVIGDAGFIARYGRAPTAADPQDVRIRAHLAFVIAELRKASPSIADPDARLRREALIDALERYAAAGAFPHNSAYPARRPVFIDEDGNVCAVGYLVEVSAGRAEAERIAALHRYDYIADIDDQALDAWTVANGFTPTELATIQPSYDWEYPRPGDPGNPGHPIVMPPLEPPPEHPPGHPIDPLPPRPLPPELAKYPAVAFLAPETISQARALGSWTDAAGFANLVFQSAGFDFLVRFDGDGQMIGSGRFDGTTLRWRAWYPSGRLAAVGKYESGVPDGAWTLYRESGSVLARLRFHAGALVRR